MRIVKRISLFFIMAGLMFSAGSYATIKAEQFFYPNRYGQQNVKKTAARRAAENTAETKEEEQVQVIETAMEKAPVITADTRYLIEEINLSDGTVQEKEEQVPVKYIGFDRLKLIEELDLYDMNPALSDLKLGFQNSELSSFSKDRVVICKYYRTEEENEGFYIMVADHYITVYEGDKQTVYLNTDILLSNLNETLQSEIIQGKYIEDEQEIYHFLESYSS